MALPLRCGGQNAQGGNEIGNGPGVYICGPESPLPDGDAAGGEIYLRPHLPQQGQQGTVALPGGQGQPIHGNALPAHGPGTEEKGGGGPIPLHSEMGGEPVALAAGDPIAAACPVQGDARCSQDLLGHGDIRGGLRRGGEGEGTVSRQQR